MNRTQTVQAVLWYDELAKAAKVQSARLRADLEADARAELEEQGTKPTWHIMAPDGIPVATVAATMSHAAIVVADDRAFAAWVAQRYPTEVEPRVRPAFQEQFLARMASVDGGQVLVGDGTDNVAVVPGLAIRRGGGITGISVRPSAAARELFGSLAAQQLEGVAARVLEAAGGAE